MNFGKQLKRVKQQADHLFLRSDRTDVVGELKTPEDQLEELRVLCEGYTRSLEKCLHTHSAPDEKKLRKVPEYQAAEQLKEALGLLPVLEQDGEQDLFRTLIGRVVELQQALGMNQLEFEDALEKQVLGPLTHLVKDEFPAIVKQKRLLKQVGLDVDAAKTRLRNAAANPGPNAKMDLYREELEEAETKLDQARDSYACDIFSLLAREREMSQYVFSYISLQRDHLQRALHKLDLVLPDVETQLKSSQHCPVYGVSLHEHLRIVQQDVAVVISVCVRRLVEVGLYEEGLLRVAGSALKVRRLKAAFDAGLVTAERLAAADEYDAHVVAGALKCYLRELPEPLLTHLLHAEWLEAVRQPDHHQRLRALWVVATRLPETHFRNLAYLVKFLELVAARAVHNKMTPGNLATVVAPNLLWGQREDGAEAGTLDAASLGRSVSLAGDYRSVVEHLVEYCDYFFKEEVDLGPIPPPPPSPQRTHPEPNGALPLPNATVSTPAPARTAPATHRRNVSADLTGRGGEAPALADPCESPKQPQRTKKKQAPRPPQVRPASTHGTLGHNGQEAPTTATPGTSDSPEATRSNTPPREAPTPATRLHHTNSLRRPTAEPPKPPGAPAKPPRPSPPLADVLEQRPAPGAAPPPPRAPVGFEQMHVPRESDSAEEDEVVLRGRTAGEEPAPIGFITEGNGAAGAGRSVQAFKQSLENMLQQQAAGQPLTLPRHAPTTQEGEAVPPPRPAAPAAVMPPTPAQRTTIPGTAATHTPARPPEPKTEKPAIKEKPIIARPGDHSAAPPTNTLPRPLVPERPAPTVAPSATPATQQRTVSTFAPPPQSYHLPPPNAPQPQDKTEQQQQTAVKTTTSGAVTATVVAEKREEGGGGGGGGGGQVEATHPFSVDKQQSTVIHLGSNPSTGPAPRPSSGGSTAAGSAKFCWPPPQPSEPTTTPPTTTTDTTTTTTATEESELNLSTADSTKL